MSRKGGGVYKLESFVDTPPPGSITSPPVPYFLSTQLDNRVARAVFSSSTLLEADDTAFMLACDDLLASNNSHLREATLASRHLTSSIALLTTRNLTTPMNHPFLDRYVQIKGSNWGPKAEGPNLSYLACLKHFHLSILGLGNSTPHSKLEPHHGDVKGLLHSKLCLVQMFYVGIYDFHKTFLWKILIQSTIRWQCCLCESSCHEPHWCSPGGSSQLHIEPCSKSRIRFSPFGPSGDTSEVWISSLDTLCWVLPVLKNKTRILFSKLLIAIPHLLMVDNLSLYSFSSLTSQYLPVIFPCLNMFQDHARVYYPDKRIPGECSLPTTEQPLPSFQILAHQTWC